MISLIQEASKRKQRERRKEINRIQYINQEYMMDLTPLIQTQISNRMMEIIYFQKTMKKRVKNIEQVLMTESHKNENQQQGGRNRRGEGHEEPDVVKGNGKKASRKIEPGKQKLNGSKEVGRFEIDKRDFVERKQNIEASKGNRTKNENNQKAGRQIKQKQETTCTKFVSKPNQKRSKDYIMEKEKINKRAQGAIKKPKSNNNKQEVKSKDNQNQLWEEREKSKNIRARNNSDQKLSKGHLAINLKNKQKREATQKTTKRIGALTKKIQLNEPSYREYCIIKGKFIPLQSTTQRKKLDNKLIETACTSPNVSHNRYFNKSIGVQQINYKKQNEQKKNHHDCQIMEQNNEIGIQTIKKELANYSILVKAAQQDIGIQYSDRYLQHSSRKLIQLLQQAKPNISEIERIKKQDIINSQATSPQPSQRSYLLETMMKLQSLEMNQQLFKQKLNNDQKRHFREICQSLISKMMSPRCLESPLVFSRHNTQISQISKLKEKSKSIQQPILNAEHLEQLMMMRQSRQNSQFNLPLKSNQQVDTSLLAVLTTFSDLFCYAQMNCEESLLDAMNSLYGLSYTDKYRCISKYYTQLNENNSQKNTSIDVSIGSRVRFQIQKRQAMLSPLPQIIYFNFIKQVIEEQIINPISEQELSQKGKIYLQQHKNIFTESYTFIHLRSIFDCINQLLTPYRPFYPTRGDPFPWTLSPLKCLTFFSIDSQSLETVIEQTQQKLTKYVRYLCGLLLQDGIYKAKNYLQKQQKKEWCDDPVFGARRQKLTKVIIDQSAEQAEDDYLELQIQSTCVLQELSFIINDELVYEFGQQLRLLKKK